MSIEKSNDNVINNQDKETNILEDETPITIYNTWDELDLNPDLLRSI